MNRRRLLTITLAGLLCLATLGHPPEAGEERREADFRRGQERREQRFEYNERMTEYCRAHQYDRQACEDDRW